MCPIQELDKKEYCDEHTFNTHEFTHPPLVKLEQGLQLPYGHHFLRPVKCQIVPVMYMHRKQSNTIPAIVLPTPSKNELFNSQTLLHSKTHTFRTRKQCSKI